MNYENDGRCPVCHSTKYEPLHVDTCGNSAVSLRVPYIPWNITLNVCVECGCVYLHNEYLEMIKEKRND